MPTRYMDFTLNPVSPLVDCSDVLTGATGGSEESTTKRAWPGLESAASTSNAGGVDADKAQKCISMRVVNLNEKIARSKGKSLVSDAPKAGELLSGGRWDAVKRLEELKKKPLKKSELLGPELRARNILW